MSFVYSSPHVSCIIIWNATKNLSWRHRVCFSSDIVSLTSCFLPKMLEAGPGFSTSVLYWVYFHRLWIWFCTRGIHRFKQCSVHFSSYVSVVIDLWLIRCHYDLIFASFSLTNKPLDRSEPFVWDTLFFSEIFHGAK